MCVLVVFLFRFIFYCWDLINGGYWEPKVWQLLKMVVRAVCVGIVFIVGGY